MGAAARSSRVVASLVVCTEYPRASLSGCEIVEKEGWKGCSQIVQVRKRNVVVKVGNGTYDAPPTRGCS